MSLVLCGGKPVFLFVPDVVELALSENEFYRKYRPAAGRNYYGLPFYQPYGKKTCLALTCRLLVCPRARTAVRRIFRLNVYTVI